MSPVRGQATDGCQGSYRDLDSNGKPDVLVINGCRIGSKQGRVYVFDRDDDLGQDKAWQQNLDLEDDFWVFEAGSEGQASLIIDFHRDGSRLVADLYDDQDADGQVAYDVVKGVPGVREGEFPSVRVAAPDGWWTRDGRVNFNLDVEIDGHIRASFVTSVPWLQVVFPGLAISTDGRPDATILVRDTDNDGRPDYEIRQVYLPVPESVNYIRTELTVSASGKEAVPQGSILWPYLGGPADYIKPYGGANPPIQVDWQSSRIRAIGEFVASRGGESNWFIYSRARFGQADNTFADFENPFCFYDLADDQDGYPELMVRSQYAHLGEPFQMFGGLQQPREAIRYSWDQDNDAWLDYKVDLLGRHAITKVASFPEFAVRTVPYAEFPAWVMGRAWDTCVFVAAEGERYGSTEGIYEGFIAEWYTDYLTGIADEPALAPVSDIRTNLRLEYTTQLLGQPWLYVSSIDRKLHLRGTRAGVWRVDEQQRVRYEDLDGDGWIDEWLFTQQPMDLVHGTEQGAEKTLKSLHVAPGFVVYGDNECVSLVRAEVVPSVYDTLPPQDHEGWLALRNQLEVHRGDWGADDFKGMFDQLEGLCTKVEGATLEDFRFTEEGFRYVLHLHPGFDVHVDDNDLSLRALPPGSYAVACDTVCQLGPLTPPQVSLPGGEMAVEPAPPRQLDWSTIHAVLHNDGLRDVQSLPVRMYAVREGGQPELLAEQEISVPAEGSHTLILRWAPQQAGYWLVWVEADAEAAEAAGVGVGSLTPLQVYVEPASIAPMFAPSSRYDILRFTWPVLLLLGGTCLAALSVLGLVVRQGRTSTREGLCEE